MFYHNYVSLCNKRNISPSAAAEEMGFHRSDVTRWSKGSQPRQATLQKIAAYFGVETSVFLDDYKEKSPLSSLVSDHWDAPEQNVGLMFYDNFVRLCAQKGKSPSGVAREIGLSNAAANGWKNGKVPQEVTLKKLSIYFGVPVSELIGDPDSSLKSGGIKIPVLGDVAAGIPIEAITDILDYEEIDESMARTGDFFGLRIKGSSMEPRMQEGDVVIIKRQETADTGDTVVVLVNGDSATVKKIKYGPTGITLIPTNPSYDPMFYSAEEVESLPVRVIGRVVELRAKY